MLLVANATFCGNSTLSDDDIYGCPSDYFCNYSYEKNGYCVSCQQTATYRECEEKATTSNGLDQCINQCLGSGTRGQINYYFPGNYTNSVSEEWEINSSCPGDIELKQTAFYIETGFDKVSIEFNGQTSEFTGDAIIIPSTSFRVYFASDVDTVDKGFILTWECAQKGDFGIIQYKDYKSDHEETWEIISTCKKVRVISTEFDFNYQNDTLTVDDKTYSGTDTIDQLVKSSNPQENVTFYVRFNSDQNINENEFILHWFCDTVPDINNRCSLLGKMEYTMGSDYIYTKPATYTIDISTSVITKYRNRFEEWSLGKLQTDNVSLKGSSNILHYIDGSYCNFHDVNRRSEITWTCAEISKVTSPEIDSENKCTYKFDATLDCCTLARRADTIYSNIGDGNSEIEPMAEKCPAVQITSSNFDINDILYINDVEYKGPGIINKFISTDEIDAVFRWR